MEGQAYYYFWLLVTGLFVSAMVYSWFIAMIVRRSLPGEMAWLFLSLAVATGANAVKYSGMLNFPDDHIEIFANTALAVASVNSCAVVVMLGRHYNGSFIDNLPLRAQLIELAKALFKRKDTSHE